MSTSSPSTEPTSSSAVERPDALDADLLPIGVLVVEADGSATYANRAWRELSGQSTTAWQGHGWLDVLRADDRHRERRALLVASGAARLHSTDWTVIHPELGPRVLRLTAAPDARDGRPATLYVAVVDVTEDRARADELFEQATRDALTGLWNRAQLLVQIGDALARRREDPQIITAVLFVDVDDLKGTNDRDGHFAGDQLLRTAAARIVAAVRPIDVVARYAGDEFVVLCERLRGPDQAMAIAAAITGVPADNDQDGWPCSLSVGVAVAADHHDAASLVHDADRDMYRAKWFRTGRGTLRLVDELEDPVDLTERPTVAPEREPSGGSA